MENPLVRPNIRRSIELIEERDLFRTFLQGPLTLHPRFGRTNSEIQSEQQEFFGFYALSGAVRSLLMAANFLVASQRIAGSKLLGPSVSLSYSAAYHASAGLSALCGSVWCDLERDPESAQACGSQVVVGQLKKKNEWQFQKQNRNHRAHWGQLRNGLHATQADPPVYFQALFEQFFRGQFRNVNSLADLQLVLASHGGIQREPFTIPEKVDEFLDMITASRHQAHYASFGGDPLVMEAMINRDVTCDDGLDRVSEAWDAFSEGMCVHVASSLQEILEGLALSGKMRQHLFTCIWYPPFDSPQVGELQPRGLAERMAAIMKAVDPRATV